MLLHHLKLLKFCYEQSKWWEQNNFNCVIVKHNNIINVPHSFSKFYAVYCEINMLSQATLTQANLIHPFRHWIPKEQRQQILLKWVQIILLHETHFLLLLLFWFIKCQQKTFFHQINFI